MLLTVDAGNLWYAVEQDILQPVHSSIINHYVPPHLRDLKNRWVGLSLRARTIVYSTERVKPSELSTYQALSEPRFKGQLCLRTSKKVYTQSLVASMIYHLGGQQTKEVVRGWLNNLAAVPHAKDSLIMASILAGQCDIGLVNTYLFWQTEKRKTKCATQTFLGESNNKRRTRQRLRCRHYQTRQK